MSFSLKQGLFKFDIVDRHAILGVNLDADMKKMRQSYLRIVQRLHPDTCKAATKAEKDFANQLLAKLVNPAYEVLSKEYGWSEHNLILGQMAKSLAKQKDQIQPNSIAARQLLQAAPSSLDLTYRQLIQPLVLEQYADFNQTLDKIGQISELNLVYLMLKGDWMLGTKKAPSSAPASKTTTSQNSTRTKENPTPVASEKQQTPATATTEAVTATPYIRRAQEYIEKNNFAQAILELRDGIKFEPNNANCHALLGLAYLKQNQMTMAKVHVSKAWQTDPKNNLTQQAKQALEKQGVTVMTPQSKPSEVKTTEKVAKSGGILGGLFGGKKK